MAILARAAPAIPPWLVGVSILGYAAYRVLRKGRHRFLGLNFGPTRPSAISLLLAIQHAGTPSLIPPPCLSPSLGPKGSP